MENDERDGGRFACEAEIEWLVRGFESCAVASFDHGSHLVVALWYLARLPEHEASKRVRAGLRQFAAHHDSNIYNETVTLFWLKLVWGFLSRAATGRPLHETANRLLATYSDPRLVFDYYSREIIASVGAKTTWVEPDLKPLDF